MAEDELVRRFRKTLSDRGWSRQTPVLLAVSGGSDSMSLLYLFYLTLGPSNIAAVHMNHGIRPTAGRDSAFVKKCCDELGVRCIIERRSVPELALKGESEEAAGRRLRYELYDQISSRLGCRLVALGHTRNDLAENVLLNIARGCGLRGLSGMPEQRGVYIRPLLSFYRGELRAFLRSHGWSWVEDETNDEDIYRRNRIRHDVMPVLAERVNPQVMEHLASLAGEALLWRETQETRLKNCFLDLQVPGRLWPTLNLKKLRRLDDFQRPELLRWVGRMIGLGSLPRGRTDELDRLAVKSGRWVFQWGAEVDAAAAGGELWFQPAAEKRLEEAELTRGGWVRWGGWRVSWQDSGYDGGQNYGLVCPAAPERPVTLKKNKNTDLFNDPFPLIEQNQEILAERKQKGWEFSALSVKYTGAAHILFIPMTGIWRQSL